MASIQNRPGTCELIAQVRLQGWQDSQVRGVTAQAGPREHIMVRVGRALLILQDRAALDQLVLLTDRAVELADDVFGAAQEGASVARAEANKRSGQHPLHQLDVLHAQLAEHAREHPPRR